MTTANHVDFSEVVMNNFAQTHELGPEVLSLDLGITEELIDAIPDENSELINALKDLLRREGKCVTY